MWLIYGDKVVVFIDIIVYKVMFVRVCGVNFSLRKDKVFYIYREFWSFVLFIY